MIIREELLHPIVLHFPIVFLLMGTLFYVLQFYSWSDKVKPQIELLFNVQFFLGLFMMWPTMFLGEIASDIIRPKLEDVSLLSRHEELAETSLYFYIAAAIVLLIIRFAPIKSKIIKDKIAPIIVLCLLFIGAYYLIVGADIGSEIVRGHGLFKSN